MLTTILNWIKWNNYPLPPKAMTKARGSKNAPFWHHWNGGRGSRFPIYFIQHCNLGQNKMEQLSPFPPRGNDEGTKEQKRAILVSLKWGEGWSRCSIYFVQDCSINQARTRAVLWAVCARGLDSTERNEFQTKKKTADGRCSPYVLLGKLGFRKNATNADVLPLMLKKEVRSTIKSPRTSDRAGSIGTLPAHVRRPLAVQKLI